MSQAPEGVVLVVHATIALVVVLGVLGVAFLLRARGQPAGISDTDIYESGMPAMAPRVAPLAPRMAFLAIAFMLFDLEVILLAGWAVAARTAGAQGLVAAAIFILVLMAALAYLWKDGALEVAPGGRP
jgi:NADH-quinone oxidoreductase subunit A